MNYGRAKSLILVIQAGLILLAVVLMIMDGLIYY